MIARVLAALAVLARPAAAWACATCLASAYGDRTYNWAYLGLLLTPLALAAVTGGALAWVALRRRRARRRVGAAVPSNLTVEESS